MIILVSTSIHVVHPLLIPVFWQKLSARPTRAPVLFGKKKVKKSGFVKPGEAKSRKVFEGSSSSKTITTTPQSPESLFPELSDEVKQTLLPILTNEEPPTLSQIEARLKTLYGFSPDLTSSLELSKTLKCLHFDPLILTVDNFLTSEECDDYVSKASTIDGLRSPTVGKDEISKKQRTSTTWHHKYSSTSELLARTCSLLGLPVGPSGSGLKIFEEPQTVRYKTSERFNWHYDALGPTSSDIKKEGGRNSEAGQRTATVLVYLKDLDGGGATAFRDLGVSVKPEKGKACIFFPSLGGIENSPADLRTLHAGEPNESKDAEKWIAQIWVREHPEYTATVPPNSRVEDAAESVEKLINALT